MEKLTGLPDLKKEKKSPSSGTASVKNSTRVQHVIKKQITYLLNMQEQVLASFVSIDLGLFLVWNNLGK